MKKIFKNKSKSKLSSKSQLSQEQESSRFIPLRFNDDNSRYSFFELSKTISNPYHQKLEDILLQNNTKPQTKFFSYSKSKNKKKSLSKKKQINITKPYRSLQSEEYICNSQQSIDWNRQNVISLSLKHCIYLYYESLRKSVQINQFENQVQCLRFSLDGRQLVCGETSGYIKLFDVQTKKQQQKGQSCRSDFVKIEWLNDFEFLSFSENGIIRLFDNRTNLNKNTMLYSSLLGISCADVNQFSKSFAFGDQGGKLIQIDIRKTKNPSNKKKIFKGKIKSLSYNPFRPSVLICSGNKQSKQIKMINILSNSIIKQFKIPFSMNQIVYLKDRENFLISNSEKGEKISIFQYNKYCQLLNKYQQEEKQTKGQQKVFSMIVNNSIGKIATYHLSNTINLWKIQNKKKSKSKNKILRQLNYFFINSKTQQFQIQFKNYFSVIFFTFSSSIQQQSSL